MNLDLVYHDLDKNQKNQLVLLKQKLLDTCDINHVPVERLIEVIAEFTAILKLECEKDLSLAINPNARIVDPQLAKMLLNVLATIQQRDSDYKNNINSACGF